jgi:hypothetical protein
MRSGGGWLWFKVSLGGSRDNMLTQLEAVEKNTPNFDKVIKHLVALNDHLKNIDAIVALSSSNNYIKIKSNAQTDELKDEFHAESKKWADKYKATIERVGDKDTYYLISVA